MKNKHGMFNPEINLLLLSFFSGVLIRVTQGTLLTSRYYEIGIYIIFIFTMVLLAQWIYRRDLKKYNNDKIALAVILSFFLGFTFFDVEQKIRLLTIQKALIFNNEHLLLLIIYITLLYIIKLEIIKSK